MSEEIVEPVTETAVEPEQKTSEELLAELTAERDKWKALSKKNEDNYKSVSQERDELKKATLTDAEKALEDARTEGRNSALSEVSTDLVTAEMALQAATAGVKLPDAQYLNVSGFLGDNGRPNKDAIKTFVDSLPAAKEEFPSLQGAGRQAGGAPEITTMDPSELADLISGGSFI
ncbi:hypothetical protein [Streptomyces sp. NBC_01500]|uniref:hypothetical protein n=1 Tax=Streptomyces sp. NBC_01500 TaxID=2903886 RepID=UPI002252727C|nr:hypothetical protein [Streptomyces sp. NBC_01500]MCX4554130.1 hypothetical protein [Streptomyces sp. NBC_01500]